MNNEEHFMMSKLELWQFTQVGFDYEDKATSTEWKYKVEGKTLYLAFKYTDSDLDWKQNFFFLPRLKKPYKEMSFPWFIHAGFLLKWKAIEDQIAYWVLDRVKWPGEYDNVVIAGHSQGGALAILCHEWWKYHNPHIPVQTVTFGAPRPVWFWNLKKIKDRFEGITQYRDRRDIVCLLPPKLFGYRDVGKIVYDGENFSLFKTISDLVTEWHTSYGDYMGRHF
jgi:hypothetical protein